MTTYKLTKQSGKTEFIEAKDFTHAERIAYGRVEALKDRVIGIGIHEPLTDEQRQRAIAVAKQLFKK